MPQTWGSGWRAGAGTCCSVWVKLPGVRAALPAAGSACQGLLPEASPGSSAGRGWRRVLEAVSSRADEQQPGEPSQCLCLPLTGTGSTKHHCWFHLVPVLMVASAEGQPGSVASQGSLFPDQNGRELPTAGNGYFGCRRVKPEGANRL